MYLEVLLMMIFFFLNFLILVTNVPTFDKDDFTSWKIRFLVFLDGLEPYLITTLKDGPFVPMSNLSTPANPLLKRQNQWSNAKSRLANQDKRLKRIIIGNDVMKSFIKYKTEKEMWIKLCLAYEGPSDTRDTKIAALRLKFNAFKALEGEKVNGTYTRLKCLLNDLENNGVIISQSEVNATFVNSLPRKWLSMNQTQRANNSIKNDSLAALYGKYHYEEGLIDDIYTDSDVEEDNKTSNEFMADQKRFYKRSGRVGSARKPMDKSKETCFACGKLGHFQKDCPSNKTSTPSYPSSNTSFNKPKPYTPSFTPNTSQNSSISQKDYKGKYKGLKAEMVVLSQRIDELTKGKDNKGKGDKRKSNKGLVGESFDWDDEFVSLEDEGTTNFKALMAIADDEPSVGKGDARSGQWVDITMKKRNNLVNKFNALKQDLALHKSELCNLKNTVSINCSLQNEVIRVNLENESLNDEISDLKKGKGRKKENNAKEVLLTKADVSTSESAPMITSDSEDDSDNQNALPSTEQLLLTLMEEVKGIKNQILIPLDTPSSVSQASSSKTPKQKVWYGPCKNCRMKNHLSDDCYSKPKCSTYDSCSHTTKEHTEQTTVRKSLNNLKGQSTSKPTPTRINRISKTFRECKYYGSNKYHPDDCEFYPGCEICESIAHEIDDYPKNLRNSKKQRVAIKQSEPTKKWVKKLICIRMSVLDYLKRYESGPKVVSGDNSSGDTEDMAQLTIMESHSPRLLM
ncbi:retrovirus-related pol polyprotein from transposon TNT 1-94 [Tanacetum coccineum]